MAFRPGFLRGLSFLGPFALIGLSRPREESGFDGLPLQARLAREGCAADCALRLLDLRHGEIGHTVRIGPDVDEIYDTAFLRGWHNLKLVRPIGDDVRYLVRPLDGRQRQDDIRKG